MNMDFKNLDSISSREANYSFMEVYHYFVHLNLRLHRCCCYYHTRLLNLVDLCWSFTHY